MKKLLLPISLFTALVIIGMGVIFFVPKERKVNLDLLVVDKDIAALTKDSVVIVSGTIKEALPSQDVVDKFGDRIVFTDYVLIVEDIIKGNVGKEIKIRTIGGSVGEGKNKFSIFAEDEPDFIKGEKVLVFLSKNSGGFFDLPADYYSIEGRFQGKYQIVDSEARNPKGVFMIDDLKNKIYSVIQLQ